MLAYVDTCTSEPQWNEMLNWEELLVVVTEKFNLSEDVEKLIVRGIQNKLAAQEEAAQEEQAMLPSDPFQDEMNKAMSSQGPAGAQNLAAMASTVGPEAAITARQGSLSGASPEDVGAAIELDSVQ